MHRKFSCTKANLTSLLLCNASGTLKHITQASLYALMKLEIVILIACGSHFAFLDKANLRAKQIKDQAYLQLICVVCNKLSIAFLLLKCFYREKIPFVSIHDCFWTSACFVDKMNQVID